MGVDSYMTDVFMPLFDSKNKIMAVNDMCRYLVNRLQMVFDYDGLDDDYITFSKRELELLLMLNGTAIAAEHENKLYVFRAGLGGLPNEYYMPTVAIVTNPYLRLEQNYNINDDCIVIPNDSLWRGLKPLLSKYATMLIEAEISLDMFAKCMRIPVIIAATDDRGRESAKVFVKHLLDGDIDIVADPAFLEGMGLHTMPFSGTNANRITDLIEYRQYLWGSLLNELGLKAAYNMKREALSDDEVSVNDLSLTPLIDNMLECRQIALKKVNEMFGTNITVKLSSAWKDLQEDIENDLKNDDLQSIVNEPERKETGGEDNVERTEEIN